MATANEQFAAMQAQVQQLIAGVAQLRDDRVVMQGMATGPRTELNAVTAGAAIGPGFGQWLLPRAGFGNICWVLGASSLVLQGCHMASWLLLAPLAIGS